MEQNVHRDLLEPQGRTSLTSERTASDMSNEQDELVTELLQQQEETLSRASVSVAAKKSEKASQRSQQKTNSRDITGIQVQPISVLLAFGAKSTLRGTPWEEALGGISGKRSKKAGKPTQRSVKEMEIISFWTQFFG